MAKMRLTMENVSEFIKTLTYADLKALISTYTAHTTQTFNSEMKRLVTTDLENRLEAYGVNSVCPKCQSTHIVKNGIRTNGVREYRCQDCRYRFSLFTGTILEKTRWHWDIWIKVLEMTLNNYSLDDMIQVLEKDFSCSGIDKKTIWLWRLKLIHALTSMPQPKLTGVIQVDETFIRESQKGSRNLVSMIDKSEARNPRYGRRPSKLGILGPEFATVVTAVDNRGYCVCKVSSLGKLTTELFVDLFDEYFENPAFLCSDANSVYDNYCELKNIPHYERNSNYLTILENNGYETTDYSDPIKAQETEAANQKLLEKLYHADLIDRITNRGYLPYAEFEALKKQNGLSLGRVNEFHADIKKFIYTEMTNVSTKYLSDYIGFFTYVRNWRVSHGHYPTSHKDAEDIFVEILKTKINYTVTDVQEQEIELPKPTGRYVKLLEKETEKARKATANKYFKFNEEDCVRSFKRREYLLDRPKTKLYAIGKECKIPRYRQIAIWSLVTQILAQPNIDEIMYRLLTEDRTCNIDEEDLQAIKADKFKT